MRRPTTLLGFLAMLALIVFGVLATQAVFAQSRSVEVKRRDAEITILSNGDVRMVETWEVAFTGGPFTFAFRSIPLNKVTDLTDWDVSEAGRRYTQIAARSDEDYVYVLSEQGGEEEIRWYFPPTTNETRTFQLEYTLQGALRIDEGGDQFFWKFVEADRDYSINSSSVTIELPDRFDTREIEVVAFRDGTNVAGALILDANTVSFSGDNFGPGVEWEIGVSFPHGIVAAEAPAWQIQEEREPIYNLIAFSVAFLAFVGGVLALILIWYLFGRDRPVSPVASHIMHPPEALPAGIAGALLDEGVDMSDIVASIVDLARRGFLEIQEVEKPSLFGTRRKFTFVRLENNTEGLLAYEIMLLNKVFEGDHERELDDLKNKFYQALPEIRNGIYQETVERGYFPTNPNRTRNLYTIGGVIALLLVGLCGWSLFMLVEPYAPLAFLTAISLETIPVGLILLSRFMPRKTALGAKAAARWQAFKRYLTNIEKYTQVETAKDQFELYLPYAIAFGLERSWVAKFAAVDAPAPIWYQMYPHQRTGSGRRGLSSRVGDSSGRAPSLDTAAKGAFGNLNSMSTGFMAMLNTTSSVFSSAPSSSGGGGGFSGGGGGGGGSSGFG